MLTFSSVHFDDFIPNFQSQSEVIEYNVLALVLQGQVCYRFDGQDYISEQGDLLYIPHRTLRAASNHPSGPHRKFTAIFYCNDDEVESLPLLKERKVVQFKPKKFHYLQWRFERLYEEFREGENFRMFICLSILQEMLGIAARELEKPALTPMKSKYAEIIKGYLLEHYRESIEIDDLARLIHRSSNYTIAVFREAIGQTPIKYIHQLRVLEACNLILNSDMSISDISNYLGYYDASYFFRIFKKYTSMSPKEFKASGSQRDVSCMFTIK